MGSVELDDELLATLQAKAEATGVPLVELLRNLIRADLNDEGLDPPEMT